jgi:hypothetical protein
MSVAGRRCLELEPLPVIVGLGGKAFERSRQEHGGLGGRIRFDLPQVGMRDLLCEIPSSPNESIRGRAVITTGLSSTTMKKGNEVGPSTHPRLFFVASALIAPP